jgi:hypothetical protein
MPFHIHPVLRFLEETREAEGIQNALDSPAVTIIKAQEAAGIRGKIVPKVTLIVRGNKYTAS